MCDYLSPAFLSIKEVECVRPITTLADECTSNLALDAKTYFEGYKVLQVSSLSVWYEDSETVTATCSCCADVIYTANDLIFVFQSPEALQSVPIESRKHFITPIVPIPDIKWCTHAHVPLESWAWFCDIHHVRFSKRIGHLQQLLCHPHRTRQRACVYRCWWYRDRVFLRWSAVTSL